MRSTDARWIVNAGVCESRMIAELRRALFRQISHLRLGAEVQTARWACLDASRFQPLRDTIHAQRTLKNFLRFRAEFRDIERASAHAISAADAMVLLEIHDAVHVLH